MKATTPRFARIAAKFAAVFVAAGVIASGAAVLAPANEAQAATMTAAQKNTIERNVEAQLVTLTNKTRVRIGLKPLKVDNLLTKSTRTWSATMSAKDSMFHSTNYPFPARTESAGENVLRAPVTASADRMEAAWEASPTHWANLAAARYTYVGFGAEIDNRGNIWVTAHFLGDVNGDYKPQTATTTKSAAAQKLATARTAFNKQVSAQSKAVSAAKTTSAKQAKAAKKSSKVRKAVAAMNSYRAYAVKNAPKVTTKSSLATVTKNTTTVKNRAAQLNKLVKAAKNAR